MFNYTEENFEKDIQNKRDETFKAFKLGLIDYICLIMSLIITVTLIRLIFFITIIKKLY